jgi:hypothetical protein
VADREGRDRPVSDSEQHGALVEVVFRRPELPRYERTHELEAPPAGEGGVIPADAVEARIAASSLSPGARGLVRGLLRLGRPAMFPGGGIGVEYGALLKTAARPDYLADHLAEAADHLRERRVDLLVVPGMSGYPVGAMYALAAGVPAILLKKQAHDPAIDPADYPPGSFVIPSYTGEGDVVMSADVTAVADIADAILSAQLAAQQGAVVPTLSLRMAGADDIIDKATMSQAVSESALVVGRAALAAFRQRHRQRTGDRRAMREHVSTVAWVTPIIKGYNRPREHLRRTLGIEPFAGLTLTGVHLDPPALGIEGVGIVAIEPLQSGADAI